MWVANSHGVPRGSAPREVRRHRLSANSQGAGLGWAAFLLYPGHGNASRQCVHKLNPIVEAEDSSEKQLKLRKKRESRDGMRAREGRGSREGRINYKTVSGRV